ncbi:MAG: (2Fe-2S) ferredoxin domain-containing protein [Bacteroidota bacterium]
MKHFRTPTCVIYVCCGSKCKKNGGKWLFKTLKSHAKASPAKKVIQIIKTGCTDRCKIGPVVAVMPDNNWYFEVSENMALEILEQCVDQTNNLS